ncbi:MAG: hypothetical protein ABSG93_06580 [Solirubrobacteraceae bacterium]
MSAEWIAGTVRGRLLLERRLGEEPARTLAAQSSLAAAQRLLLASAYGRDVGAAQELAPAQRAVAATALWHLRIFAGWLPPDGAVLLRALAAWYELVNIEHHIAWIVTGASPPPPFELGGLATVWPRVEPTRSAAEVRAALAASPWGEPASEEPLALHLALRAGWARRVIDHAGAASEWARAAVALLVARELLLGDGEDQRRLLALPGVSASWLSASSVPELAARLPARIGWVLREVERPEQLWRAELDWWRRVEDDAQALMRSPVGSPALVVGTVALLMADARRAGQALAIAALGGSQRMRERADAAV